MFIHSEQMIKQNSMLMWLIFWIRIFNLILHTPADSLQEYGKGHCTVGIEFCHGSCADVLSTVPLTHQLLFQLFSLHFKFLTNLYLLRNSIIVEFLNFLTGCSPLKDLLFKMPTKCNHFRSVWKLPAVALTSEYTFMFINCRHFSPRRITTE